jgi:hypothetical protein
VEGYRIASGKIQSCGCSRKNQLAKDLTGQRFGRLTAIRRLDRKKGSCYLWLCRCDCGQEIVVRGQLLRKGSTRSCGCYRKMSFADRAKTGLAPNGKEREIDND